MSFQAYIKSERDKYLAEHPGSTQADFAAFLGFPTTSVSNWLNAGIKPRGESIIRLVKKLGFGVYVALGMRLPNDDPSKYPLSIQQALAKAVKRVSEEHVSPDSDEGVSIFMDEVSKVDRNAIS